MALSTLAAAGQPAGYTRREGKLVTREYELELAANERAALVEFVRRQRFQDMHLLPNFKSNYTSLARPTGYVARQQAVLPFVADAYVDTELLDGFAYVEVEKVPRLLDDETRRRFHRCMNVCIPSVSPRPAVARGGGEDWVASLGKGGYACLYRGKRRAGAQTQTHDEPDFACVCVYAGLDLATRRELDLFLYQQAARADVPSYSDMFAPDTGLIEPFRAVARETRKRLLGQLIECLGLKPVGAEVVERPCAFSKSMLPDEPGTAEALRQLGMGRCRVPSWYVTPGGDPLGAKLSNPLEVQKQPLAVSTCRETICNDVVFLDDVFMASYMGSACTLSPFGVPYTRGPGNDLVILNPFSAERNWKVPDKFNAFAFQPRQEFSEFESAAELVTWSPAGVNRNVNARYAYNGPGEMAAIKSNDWLQLECVTGVVSVVDRSGNTRAPPTDLTRFATMNVTLTHA